MTNFEDHLWTELVREHGDVLAKAQRRAPRDRRGPRLLAGAGLGVAGTGTALALILGASTAAPAFAVTRNHDGTVTVWIKRTNGITGANARLAQLGIPAQVAFAMPTGCGQTISIKGSPVPAGGAQPPRQGVRTRWTIDPRQVPAGRTIVLSPARPGQPRNYAGKAAPPPDVVCDCPTSSIHGRPRTRGVGKNKAVQVLPPGSSRGRGRNRACRLDVMSGAAWTRAAGQTISRRSGVKG